MDNVDIICTANDSICIDILKNFLTSVQKEYPRDRMQTNNDIRKDLSKPSIFLFFDGPEIAKDINTTLDNINPNGYFIMIIVVTHGRKGENRCIPKFTLPSKVRMWSPVWGAEDKTCPSTEENRCANIMLECFLNISRDKVMHIQDNDEIPSASHTDKGKVDRRIQPMDIGIDMTNISSNSEDDSLQVICSKTTEKIFQSFSKFMKTNIGVSTRINRDSKKTPLVALCLQHDDTKKEIEELQCVIGRPATLIMISACEFDVPLTPTEPSVEDEIFPVVVYLRYSESRGTIYDFSEKKTTEKLKQMFNGNQKSWSESFFRTVKDVLPTSLVSSKKDLKHSKTIHNPVGMSHDTSKIPKKETKLSSSLHNRGTQLTTSEHSFPVNNIVMLCNRKDDVCKDIIMDFKSRYSFHHAFQWISSAKDISNVAKRVLVCLKMSRLADDVVDAIKMVDLSDADTFLLIIIHTAEPGVNVDTSFSSRDQRISNVAHIVYSENCGCYDCPENKNAISILNSWLKS